MDRVIDPIVTDMQTEYESAMRAQCWWRAAWIRINGYSAFWKAVGLYSAQAGQRTLWASVAEDGWALGRTLVYTLVAFIAFTLLLTALPMVEFYSRIQNLRLTLLLLPQAIPLTIPIALALGIACGVGRPGATGRRIRGMLLLPIAGMLLASAAMLIIPDANQAFRVAMAEELGSRGITKYSLPRGMNELPASELWRQGREYDDSGSAERAREFRRAYHIRFALPASTFVLSLLALAIAGLVQSRVRRVAAIVIALGLYGAMLADGGRSTSLPAALSVWAPNIVFTLISLGLLKLLLGRQSSVTQ